MGSASEFRIGDWVAYPLRSCIERGRDVRRVKPKSMAVLVELAAARGEVVTREALFDAVWPGCAVTDDVLTQSIGELRKAFGDSARDARVIETIPKIGFRLVADVSHAPASPPRRHDARYLPRGTWLVSTVVVAFVAGLAFFGFVARPGDTRVALPADGEQSVAVLPFVDMSPEQDQAYFADGLAEELIIRLTQLEGLRVTGRTSSFYFKGRSEDLRTIGAALSVGHILEGSVRKSGDELRITAQLVEVSNGFHLWSATYDRPQEDLFAIQDDIADAVANALSIRLSVGDLGRVVGGTQSVAAFDELMLGNAAHKEFDADGIARAIDHFHRATEIDPEFAIAWVELANAYRNAWLVFGTDDLDEWHRIADEAIARATRLAPDSIYVLMTTAFIHADRQDWRAAMQTLDRVAELESREFVQRSGIYTDFMTKTGHIGEAIKFKERARLVDPLHSGTSMYLAHLYTIEGRFDDAFAELEAGWQLEAYRPQLAAEGVAVALSARDEERLRHWLERAVEHEQPGARGAHSAMLERLGDRDAALAWLRNAYAESGSTDYYVVLWASYLGDTALAMAALERSLDLWAVWLPVVAPLRAEADFGKVVAAAGLDAFWDSYGWGEFCEPVADGIRCR